MPVFTYTFRDASGGIQKGTADAESEEILRKRFTEQGLTITELTMIRAKSPKAKNSGKVKLRVLAIFCRQFSTMVDAGVSLVRSLDVLQQQTADPRLKKILNDVGQRVEGGESLSRAMARHPKCFSNLFLGLVRAGEVGGVLEETLQRLSVFLEADYALRQKVRSAMTYPVLVMIFSVLIVAFLVYWFVPQWIDILKGLGLKSDALPAPTQFLITVSNVSVHYGLWIIIGLIILFILYRVFVSTRFGRRVADRVKLKIPIFGKLHHNICLARFSRTMGTLLTSGVPILQSMETVAGTVGNTILSDTVLEARARIREGDRIGEPLEKSKQFPPMVVHMVGVGEESGSLDFMLQKIADFYEREVENTISRLTAMIEPIMIVSLGVVVGFIVVSMFLPLVQAIAQLSSGGGS